MSFLSETIAQVRLATDEPSTAAKYTDTIVTGLISKVFAGVWSEIVRQSDHKIVIRTDITIVSGTRRYILPPTMTRIIDIHRLDSSGNILCYYNASPQVNPIYPSFHLEGNTLYFSEAPNEGYTLRFLWVPSGYIALHNGTAADGTAITFTADPDTDTLTLASAHGWQAGQAVRVSNSGGALPTGLSASTTYYVSVPTTNTVKLYTTQALARADVDGTEVNFTSAGTPTHSIVSKGVILASDTESASVILAASPTVGSLDSRPNAYVGSILRILTCEGEANATIQDRVISAYNPQTRTATLVPGFEAGEQPAGVTTYEITPLLGDDLILPVSEAVARTIVSWEGDRTRYMTLNTEYNRHIRDIRLRETHFNTVMAKTFRIATVRSPNVLLSTFDRVDNALQ